MAPTNHESSWKTTNGGLPQGTCLDLLLFAILVNPLLKDWNGRLNFVDDTTALEIVPRCSPSLLPLVVQEISNFSSARGMELNPKKCKEMIINFLQYRIPCDQSMFINSQCVERVHTLLISRSRYYSKKGVKKKVPVDSVLGVFFTPSF